jgi:hypothetical protein
VEVKNLSVKYNTASGAVGGTNAVSIDWSSVVTTDGNPIRTLTSDATLVVSGVMRLNLGGYVLASGSFVVTKATAFVAVTASETVSADLLTIDLTGVNLFVGVGAAFDGANASINSANATGFLASGANLSVALAKSTQANDTRRWTGIAASAASLSVVVDGVSPITYQWTKVRAGEEDVVLPNQTAMLSFASTVATDSGSREPARCTGPGPRRAGWGRGETVPRRRPGWVRSSHEQREVHTNAAQCEGLVDVDIDVHIRVGYFNLVQISRGRGSIQRKHAQIDRNRLVLRSPVSLSLASS